MLHWIARACLLDAYRPPRKSRAPGADQGTAQQDAEPLDDHLQDLHERRRDHRSVAPPVERVWSEQDEGKQRPLGNPGCEDKMVQRAVGLRLEAIFAPELPGVSPGFRKGPRQPQAWPELRELCRTLPMAWLVEAAVRACGDHLAWGQRREVIQPRGRAGGLWSLLGKGLHAGGRESGALRSPAKGTPPGGVRSPRVAKGFLPRVWAEGFVKEGPPGRQGRGLRTRCAADVISGCA